MAVKTYDLDDSVAEYFEFKLKGHLYKFTHPTTEEMMVWKDAGTDEEKALEEMSKFITRKDESAPEFKDVYKQMIAPNRKLFTQMITSELGS